MQKHMLAYSPGFLYDNVLLNHLVDVSRMVFVSICQNKETLLWHLASVAMVK